MSWTWVLIARIWIAGGHPNTVALPGFRSRESCEQFAAEWKSEIGLLESLSWRCIGVRP
jgi:hypothetical protein